jgi:hypothetical protein
MCNKRRVTFFLTIFLLFLIPPQIQAFSLEITDVKQSLVSDKEQIVSVDLLITDLPSGESYFRAGWKSGNSYIGYVQNNSGDWIKLNSLSGECKNYFKIDQATTSATLNIKIGSDNEISNGETIIRAHRITSSCSSNYSSNEYSSTINLPTPTPEPTESPTPEPTNTFTPTPTQKPTNTPTLKPIPTKTPTATSSANLEQDESSESGFVNLGFVEKTTSPESEVLGKSTSNKFPFTAIGLIISGLGFMGFGGFSLYKRFKNQYNDSYEESS